MPNKPQFPIFIPTKGRYESRLTIKILEKMGVHYHAVVEESEYKKYKAVCENGKILVLDKKFQDEYDTCDHFGDSKSKGPGPARNFAWAYAVDKGYPWHWVMDDNIYKFYRLHKNTKIKCSDGTPFKVMEDFCLRYENIAMAGPDYDFFAPRKVKLPPFICNTRIYSCALIRNDIPFRWRARYNEDTILSLDILKAGWVTVQFYAFLQKKAVTQLFKGGCTDEFYHKEGKVDKNKSYADGGTLAKSRMQQTVHPDVSKLVKKYGRWHHFVDYRPFKKNKLIRKKDYDIPDEINNYGMILKKS